MNQRLRGAGNRLLLATGLLWGSASGSAAAESYLTRLQSLIPQVATNLPALTSSAVQAAQDAMAGGNLWAAGRQEDFISEACGRAGGLMAMAGLGQRAPTNHEVVLYAVPGALGAEDLRVLGQWRENGATVVTFSSAAGLYREHFPLDTVANVIELWAWTGEFVGACTRQGRMPVLYQTYGLPGGPERGKKYQGKRFHDDLTIQPIPAGALGREYLGQIDGMLSRLADGQMSRLVQAAGWWEQATSATVLAVGHMYPRHMLDPRGGVRARFAAVPAWEDKPVLDASDPPQFVLYIGYQFAPRKLIEQAAALRVRLVYTDVQPAQPPEPDANVLYIDPGWPLADGCVPVPGYDVPILPASGVIQAAIYWTIASERARRGP